MVHSYFAVNDRCWKPGPNYCTQGQSSHWLIIHELYLHRSAPVFYSLHVATLIVRPFCKCHRGEKKVAGHFAVRISLYALIARVYRVIWRGEKEVILFPVHSDPIGSEYADVELLNATLLIFVCFNEQQRSKSSPIKSLLAKKRPRPPF